ncbi:MAG: acid phosphatase, partial [Saccharolobus sp.]
KVPDYNGYAQVFPAPELSLIIPFLIIGFGLLIFSIKKRVLIKYAVIPFLISLSISAYVYNINNIYSFITQYYLVASLIGFLANLALLARVLRK